MPNFACSGLCQVLRQLAGEGGRPLVSALGLSVFLGGILLATDSLLLLFGNRDRQGNEQVLLAKLTDQWRMHLPSRGTSIEPQLIQHMPGFQINNPLEAGMMEVKGMESEGKGNNGEKENGDWAKQKMEEEEGETGGGAEMTSNIRGPKLSMPTPHF